MAPSRRDRDLDGRVSRPSGRRERDDSVAPVAQSRYRTAHGHVRDTGSIHDAGRMDQRMAQHDFEHGYEDERSHERNREQARYAQGRARQRHSVPVKKESAIRRLINNWFNRIVGAVSEGDLAGQEEEYAAGRTSRDFVWNSIGQGAWGMVFPILTIVVTQLAGVERAGLFSFVFVIANLLYIIGTYGVRTYQVSDIDEYHSFSDYQINRFITCIIMLLCGFVVMKFLGYEGEAATMCMGIFIYKTIDALGEVYEGRLQQVDKLYLAGISMTIRSAGAFIAYTVLLLITGNLGVAAIAMAIWAAASFVVVTFPLTLFETKRSAPAAMSSIIGLFKACFPVFLALFMYAVIDNMPKFVMQGAQLPYDNQLYFNALYFPAQAILIIVQLIYRPLLVKMARIWADPTRRKRFDLLIVAMMALIVAITLVGAILMAWIGVPVMSLLYGIDFSPYWQLAIIMLAAGGVTAGIDFLYQIITILRRQHAALSLYAITFGFSFLVLILMINMMQLEGAVVGYLIVMTILFILLLREYILQRMDLARQEKGGR